MASLPQWKHTIEAQEFAYHVLGQWPDRPTQRNVMDNEDLLALFAGCITSKNEVDIGACLVAADKLEELGFEMESDLLRTVDRSRKVLRFRLWEKKWHVSEIMRLIQESPKNVESTILMQLRRSQYEPRIEDSWREFGFSRIWMVGVTIYPAGGGKGTTEIWHHSVNLRDLLANPKLFSARGKEDIISYEGLVEIKYEEVTRQPSAIAKALFS